MSRLKVHVLYEYGSDLRPFGSASIRLLRPLTHPSLHGSLEVSAGRAYQDQKVDAVIVDRLWRPDITLDLARRLVNDVRLAGARLVYALDDNFLDLPAEHKYWQGGDHLDIFRFFLQQADGVLVTTPMLKGRLREHNPNIFVLPHALDERLLVPRKPEQETASFQRPLLVGYMGTLTHDEDLIMILPALKAVHRRHTGQIRFQLVGAVGMADSLLRMRELSARVIGPDPREMEYPLFMLWYTGRVRWDIAIAPLRATPFTDCKSDIKFLDYSAIGAAGIYSHSPAYEKSVHHGQNGLLVENTNAAWEQAFETLLADGSLRSQIALSAYHFLYTNRTLAQCAGNWLEAIEAVLGST